MYRKIRRCTQQGASNKFTRLIVNQQQQEQIITEPEEVFQHLICRNRKHFSQAEGTPFTQPPLSTISTLTQLRQLPQISTNEAVQQIIEYLLMTPNLPSIDAIIDTQTLQQLYTVWNEYTTTSPSGIHLGHEKSILPVSYTHLTLPTIA